MPLSKPCIRFTKTPGKTDLVEFFNGAHLIKSINLPKQGTLPHDLIHAIVESNLKISGFIDLVFAGRDPYTIRDASEEAWLAEAMVESIQGMQWSEAYDFEQFVSWIATICEQRKVPAMTISKDQFNQLISEISKYHEKWKALPERAGLDFLWKS